MDRAAIAARLFAEPVQRRSAWLLPAGALLAAAAVALIALFLWPRPPIEPAGRTAAVEPDRQTPIGPPAEPARVTYSSGQVAGPEAGLTGWTLPIGRAIRVGPGAGLSARLDPDTALTALADSRLEVDWRAGWDVRLDEGGLVARLASGRPHRFRVHCKAGSLEALGTVFSLRTAKDGAVRIALAHGRVRLESAGGRSQEIQAPARARWSAEGLADLDQSEPERWPLLELALAYDPEIPGPFGTLAVSAQPEKARVLVDGRVAGDTPLVVALPVGERHLEVRAPGYEPYRTVVAIAEDRLVSRRAQLAQPPARPPAAAPRDLVAEARRLLAARRVAEARGLLERRLAAHPDDARALLLAADAERIGGDAQAALESYLEIPAATRDARISEAALFQAGLLRLHTLDRPAEALATFETLRRKYPRGLLRQEVAFHLAESYLATGDYRRSVRAFEDYLRLYPQGTKAAEARELLTDLEKKGWK